MRNIYRVKIWDEFGSPIHDIKESDTRKMKKKISELFRIKLG